MAGRTGSGGASAAACFAIPRTSGTAASGSAAPCQLPTDSARSPPPTCRKRTRTPSVEARFLSDVVGACAHQPFTTAEKICSKQACFPLDASRVALSHSRCGEEPVVERADVERVLQAPGGVAVGGVYGCAQVQVAGPQTRRARLLRNRHVTCSRSASDKHVTLAVKEDPGEVLHVAVYRDV